MNVLLDTCVWGRAADLLRAVGHDVVWAGDWARDPGDAEILSLAHEQERVLITLDKDFGELAVGFGHPHSGIVRLVGFRASEQGPAAIEVLERYQSDLLAGAIITAEPGHVRVRGGP